MIGHPIAAAFSQIGSRFHLNAIYTNGGNVNLNGYFSVLFCVCSSFFSVFVCVCVCKWIGRNVLFISHFLGSYYISMPGSVLCSGDGSEMKMADWACRLLRVLMPVVDSFSMIYYLTLWTLIYNELCDVRFGKFATNPA